jgi:hypothetical protein
MVLKWRASRVTVHVKEDSEVRRDWTHWSHSLFTSREVRGGECSTPSQRIDDIRCSFPRQFDPHYISAPSGTRQRSLSHHVLHLYMLLFNHPIQVTHFLAAMGISLPHLNH